MLKIEEGAIVCRGAELTGDVTIGMGTVVHPNAKIIAKDGPVVIGQNNIIEEQVELINSASGGAGAVMIIGNGNVFEVGAVCRASNVGDDNVIETRAVIETAATLGSNCSIGAYCTVATKAALADCTVVFGSDSMTRTEPAYKKPDAYREQLAHLQGSLHKFHPLQKGGEQ